ncbi:MAG: glycosyltransferase family 1 protein [Alphaproteobacteria bacterium]|nr:glycosyltransferase family 1 protein [Alphaproteobacteria bacterium]
MKIIFDISFIGLGLKSNIKTGVYRFIDSILKEFIKNNDLELYFSLSYHIDTHSLVVSYLKDLNIDHQKLITPPKFTGWFNPYHFGNKQLRKLYNLFGITNKGEIPVKYLNFCKLFYSPYYPIPNNLPKIIKCITIYDLIPIMPKYKPFMNADFKNISSEIKNVIKSLPGNYISTISQFTKNDLLEQCNTLNANQITPIHLGIDINKFNNKHSDADWLKVKAKYNVPDAYFLTLETIEPRKNCLHIIKSFQHFAKTNTTNISLVIAGDQTTIYKKQLLEQSDILNKIVFIGPIEENDLPILYSRANSFYFMSLAEGFGFPPLEAMACGVPVVTSNTSSLPEIIGKSGIVLNPENVNELAKVMYMLSTSNSMRTKYIELGLEHIKQFTWEKTAQNFFIWFQNVLNENKYKNLQ